MSGKYLIQLATASPLYAPIYIAKELELPGFDQVELDYSDPPNYSSNLRKDDLIETLLDPAYSPETILAVCDPMRVTAIELHKEQYHTPLVLGSLINKMVYWFIDSNHAPVKSTEILNKFKSIIVHPMGMTGYATTFYFLRQTLDRELYSSKDIERRLFPCSSPGKEKTYYKYLKAFNRSKFLYVTMNPYDVYNNEDMRNRPFSALYFDKDETCNNSIMTAFVTGKGIYRTHKALIDQLLDSVCQTIDFIKTSPAKAAKILHAHEDKHLDINNKWSIDNTQFFFEKVIEKHIYNSSLKYDQEHVENSKKIWRELENVYDKIPHHTPIDEVDPFFNEMLSKKWSEENSEAKRIINSLRIKQINLSLNKSYFEKFHFQTVIKSALGHSLLSFIPLGIALYVLIELMDKVEMSQLDYWLYDDLYDVYPTMCFLFYFLLMLGVIYPANQILKYRKFNVHPVQFFIPYTTILTFVTIVAYSIAHRSLLFDFLSLAIALSLIPNFIRDHFSFIFSEIQSLGKRLLTFPEAITVTVKYRFSSRRDT